jgi:hypothetical protein
LSGILSFFIKKLNEKKKALTVFSAFIIPHHTPTNTSTQN